MALDLLWPLFLLAGWEQVRIDPGNTAFTPLDFVSYPYSHSLAMSVVWGILFALLYWGATRYVAGAVVIGFGVVSHWILDFVTHRPDLPLYPGGTARVGLGLWILSRERSPWKASCSQPASGCTCRRPEPATAPAPTASGRSWRSWCSFTSRTFSAVRPPAPSFWPGSAWRSG